MSAAWIVQWQVHGNGGLRFDERPHILPYRWSSASVLAYMRCLYWNSPLFTPFESHKRVQMRQPPGVHFSRRGRRLYCGDKTHLSGVYVIDLVITRESFDAVRVEWTNRAPRRYDHEVDSFVSLGTPTKRTYLRRPATI